jgi:hypothetical protein
MNISAGDGGSKWPFGGGMVTVVTLLVACVLTAPAEARRHADFFSWEGLFGSGPRRLHRTVRPAKLAPPNRPVPSAPMPGIAMPGIPLPHPRPEEAPRNDERRAATTAARGEPEILPMIQVPSASPSVAGGPAQEAAVPAAPQPSACRQALTEEIVIAPSIPPIHGSAGCGGEDLVRLEAIVLPGKRRVQVSPAATLRCTMASAVADWVRTDIAPLADKLGSRLAALDNLDSYDCRARNGIKGAPLSEHGRANALDVQALRLVDGRTIALTDRSQPRELREKMLHSACTRFTTVLGPDSDWYHEDHIHLDLMERHNNYKICQWDVLDELPKVAPLLPAGRPAEAPPRKVARKEDAKETAK